MMIPTVENQQKGDLKSGQKIYHDKFGRGIIVGFSEVSDEPVVYFYDYATQLEYNDRVICLSKERIKCVE